MNLKNIITIVKKELVGFYTNIASYIALIVFLLLWEFLFFRNALLIGESSLRLLYDLLPWLSLLLVPAVTMSTISKEKEDGTLEVVLTHPINDLDLIIGKWIASVIFVISALLFAIPVAVSFASYGKFDWGAFAGQFTGSILFVGALASLGIFISSLISSTVASLLVTIASAFMLIVIGTDLVTANLPLSLVPIFARLSLINHLQSISRGVIDTRDVWYFISFAGVFIGLTYLEFMKRKYGNVKDRYHNVKIGLVLWIGIAVLTNIVGERIPGRIDLTSEKSFTLSKGTKKILGSLPDIVTISLYASSRLPPQYEPIARETRDILADFKTAGKNNLVITVLDPTANDKLKQEAFSYGIQEVQFNVVSNEEFQVKTGYMGLVVDYAGEYETIPFVQSTEDLEYQLASNIYKLTSKEKKVITFFKGHGEKRLATDVKILERELARHYEVVSEEQIASESALLIIDGPKQHFTDETINAVKAFIEEGKNALILADGFDVSLEEVRSWEAVQNVNEIIKDYGITVNKSMAYDLRSNKAVSLGGGPVSFIVPYPFWLQALPAKVNSPIIAKVNSVMMPWASSLAIDEEKLSQKGYKTKKLIVTSQSSGELTGNVNIIPNQTNFSQENLKELTLSALVEPNEENQGGKLIVAGDSDFSADQYLGNSPENLIFMLNAVSYLAQGNELSSIVTRTSSSGRLIFKSESDALYLKYGNMALTIVLPILLWGGIFLKRRKNKFLKYTTPS